MTDTKAKRREERVKLFATALSNVGVATVIAGFIAPAFSGRIQPVIAIPAFIAGFGLHLAAQGILHYVVVEVRSIAPPNPELEP